MENEGAPINPHRHHHRRRRHRHRHHRGGGHNHFPAYARIAVPILGLLLVGWLFWQGTHSLLHLGGKRTARAQNGAHAQVPADPFIAPWVHDFNDSLETSARLAKEGNLTAAQIYVDRAESFITIAGLEHLSAPPDFFKSASGRLDHLIELSPGNRRLFEAITSARTELAALRTAQETPPSDPPQGRVVMDAPRHIIPKQALNPATLGGKYLDATPLPALSEILVPPSSRALADNVRVEDLTIVGAAQTLDGIRWRNVTFFNTHLRYQGGGLSLQNVRFIRCRFGLSYDERAARIANAIALAPPPGAVTITENPAP